MMLATLVRSNIDLVLMALFFGLGWFMTTPKFIRASHLALGKSELEANRLAGQHDEIIAGRITLAVALVLMALMIRDLVPQAVFLPTGFGSYLLARAGARWLLRRRGS